MSEKGLLSIQPVPAVVRLITPKTTDEITPHDAIKMGEALIQQGDVAVMHPNSTVLCKFPSWTTKLTAAEALILGRNLIEAGESVA